MVEIILNGKQVHFDGDEDLPLLWFLRGAANLKGTKYGCGIGQCGACTVHIDGRAVRSCVIAMKQLGGAKITTIEGLAAAGALHPVQQAWIEEDVAQCGYCQPGQIMAVAAFLEHHPNPTDDDIDSQVTNICRCGTYPRIRKAIHAAAEKLER